MDSLEIKGGTPLNGEVQVSGAKNAVLPILAATLLTREPCVIRNVPDLADVRTMCQILESLGASTKIKGDSVTVQAEKVRDFADYDLVRKMRGSLCVLGPLLARLGEATVSMPGGCVIGTRPVDLHRKAMEALGAKVNINKGYILAKAKKLSGGEMFLGGRAGPTVLGTANAMMAATLAEGITVIEHAACEPEVVDLGKFLNNIGAQINGLGSPTLTITGVKELGGAEHEVIPDRIEAATYAIAGVATNGEVTLKGARQDHMKAVIEKLREAGVKVDQSKGKLTFKRGRGLHSVHVTTLPHPGFPTDVQAQMMAFMTQTPGISIITERIFESRFTHVQEMERLGAEISIEGPSAIVHGVQKLSGAEVMASDLRASAALVIAGMVAEGTTQVNRIYHLDRGYEKLDTKLEKLGAKIKRVKQN
ncbi:MAG TPA: UDP-N-acetylglucosamine 1-carboxyvinyltransferase [Verrucomicrobiales bacterium]|nr:UDP-N-acetylglucosamine 1-carboxyvinyltransferase [Verrucomicrobiales bacterium]